MKIQDHLSTDETILFNGRVGNSTYTIVFTLLLISLLMIIFGSGATKGAGFTLMFLSGFVFIYKKYSHSFIKLFIYLLIHLVLLISSDLI